MTKHLAQHVSTRETPPTQPVPGKPLVANSGGGYSFQVDDWTRLKRFLVIGSEGGTYYVRERELTVQNVECLQRCADADFARALELVVDVSARGLAPKNDYALLCLALLAARPAPQGGLALRRLGEVARIGTHLFTFLGYLRHFRGRGRAVTTALRHWYLDRSPQDVAHQAVKYAQRGGMSHHDVLRLCKPGVRERSPEMEAVLEYITGGDWRAKMPPGPTANYLEAVERLKADPAPDVAEAVRLITDHRLPREVLPTELLNRPEIWEALLPGMPAEALVRNLGKMTAVGLLRPMSAAGRAVAEKLRDGAWVRRNRLHPFKVLLGATTYAAGRGVRATQRENALSWTPDRAVIEALDDAFTLAFEAVEPTGARHLLALDVSGSMEGARLQDSHLTAREAAAAMAMVTVRTEPQTHSMAFSSGFIPLPLTARDSLRDVVRKTRGLPFDSTNCAMPMIYALAHRIEVDAFVIYTDNEVNHGTMHPYQALLQYRERMGLPAKLIVVGMTSNGFTIADPADVGSLDVVGFSGDTPGVMAEFIRG